MKTAIVTGASRGIGKEITIRLLKEGYKVIGLARDFSNTNINADNFIYYEIDLLNINRLELLIKKIKKEDKIDVLINNAGMAYFGMHEQLNSKKISQMVDLNLKVPMILSQLLLRDIKNKKGFIINILSITAKKISPIGLTYSATKAGLSHFSKGLFEENRKYGLKVTAVYPDITATGFYDDKDFTHGDNKETYISSDEVAEAVLFALNNENRVITELTIQPQKHQIKRKPKA